MTLKDNPNFKIQIRFTFSMTALKIAELRFGLLVDKNIFAIGFIDDNCCEYLFCYLQLGEDNNKQNKPLQHLFYHFQLGENNNQ